MSENFYDLTKKFISIAARFLKSPAVKLGLISFLLLILAIPLLTVALMNNERQSYANNAKNDIAQKWGSGQTVRGPYLVVPTIKRREIKIKTKDDKTETKIETTRRLAVFLPEKLNIKSDVQSETRERGIFSFPVYRSILNFSGKFVTPDTTSIEGEIDELIWKDAILILMVKDARAIKKNITLSLNNGAEQPLFRAGVPNAKNYIHGVHARIPEQFAKGAFDFSFKLHLNGSSNLYFAPSGGETDNQITSTWPHPSFQGSFLPNTRKISHTGFTAQWSIPRLARGTPQVFLTNQVYEFMSTSLYGVDLFQPSGFYNLLERSLKYAMGFMAIAFFVVFIMEVRSGKQVHLVQYFFVGLAQIIFYLTLLGISEHTGFETGYAISSAATIALLAIYVGGALKSFTQGLILAILLTILYGLLYMLLRVEDYAMLIGSIAAFTLLAITMFFTRSVKWSGSEPATDEEKTS